MSASQTPGDGTPDVVPSTEADAIARKIEQRQARLAADVDELATRVHPRALVRSTSQGAVEKARAAVVADDGSPRVERVAAVACAVLVLVGALLLRGRRRRRA